jgi:cyclophilin family peptidyl-prolyl cis-trans isomerase
MSSFKRASADAAELAVQARPGFEPLEGRLLLSAPSFDTPLGEQYSVADTGQALAIGIDGYADNGDALTITAVSDDANLQVVVLTDTRFALLHFVAADGTDIGDVLIELFDSYSATAVEQFVTLATTGYDSDGVEDASADPYYTDVAVHRVISNFMIQTGDAENGDGTGGSPLGEFTATVDENLSFSGAGVLAMANSGDVSSSDSQFFITDTAYHSLDGDYLILGQVISGMDIISTLINLPTDSNDKPLGTPILQSVEIISSNQDGVVLLIPQEGFDGSATVTITLNDTTAGTSTSQDIAVVSDPAAGSMGTISMPDQEIFTTAGSTTSFTPEITAPDGVTTMNVAVSSDKAGVTASIDPDTYEVTLTVADDFTGSARIRVTAWPDGYDNYANWPVVEGVVYVNSSGQISLDDPGLLNVTPGELTTITATGGGLAMPAGTTLSVTNPFKTDVISTDSSFHVNITTQSDFTGFFQSTLTASQGTAITQEVGYVQSVSMTLNISSQNADDYPITQFLSQVTDGTGYASVTDGNMLYVANGAAGLSIYDVTDPSAPALLYTYDTSGTLYDVKIIHRTIDGSDHTVAMLCDLDGGIISLDVTTPTSPTALDTVSVDSTNGEYAVSIAIAGNVAYVAEYYGGLVAYDITDLENITELGAYTGKSEIVGVAVEGNYAYITGLNNGDNDYDYWAGLAVIDVTDPTAMSAVGFFDTSKLFKQWGSPWGVAISGNYLYVADQYCGLLVYNISNPTKIKYVSRLVDTSYPWQVTVTDQVAITSGYGEVRLINITNPAKMSVIYSYLAEDQFGLASVSGTTLILPIASIGLVLMDTTVTTVITSAVFISDSGVSVTISIKGGGKLNITTTGVRTGDITNIEVEDPTSKTTVTISTKSGAIASVGSVDIQGSIASFSAPNIDLAGNFVADGTVASLKMHDVIGYDITLHDDSALAINSLVQATITLNRVENSQLDANDEPIKSLTVTRWLDSDATADTITAPSIGTLSVTGNRTGVLGDFQADLLLSGSAAALVLGKVSIAHSLSGSEWDLTGQVGTISVLGIVSGWTFDPQNTVTYVKSMSLGNVSGTASSILVDGAIGSLSAGQWIDGSIGADSIGTLTTGSKTLAGDFSADVTLTGQAGKVTIKHDLSGDWSALSIGTLTVKNDMTGAHLTLTQSADATSKLWALGTLSVAGSINDSWINSAGNIKSITTKLLLDSTIYAGVTATHDTNSDGVFDLFDPNTDTFSQDAYIKSLTVKGDKYGTIALQNSNVAAARLGTVKLANGLLDNSGTSFGLAADTLTKFSYADAALKYTWPNKDPNDATSPHLPAEFVDFAIRLV